MSFIDSRLTKFAFFCCVIFTFFACTKITNTNIGSGLIPPVDGVITKDTVLDIVTKNQAFDTVAVGFSDDHVLGATTDPVFGTTNAAINLQVALPNASFSFGVNKFTLVADSVILSFSYKGVWGDSTQPLTLHVYEMDPETLFSVDSAYKNTVSFEKGTEITRNDEETVYPYKLNDIDTLPKFNEDATNQLRIHLSTAFANRLLYNYDSSNAYQNDSTFHNAIRGFIVEADQQQGNALLQLNLSDTSTRLSLYYHIDGNDSSGAVRRFATNALSCASSNTITRNYQGTAIPNYFPANSNTQDSLLYIQTSPGTYAQLTIPGLSGLSNMIVHRAEILMSQVPDVTSLSDQTFTSPDLFLAAYSKDSARRFAVPNDLIFSSGTFVNLTAFGVLPIKKTDALTGKSISTYSFDISRYTQGVVTRKDSVYNLILWAPYNAYIHPVLETPYLYPISTPALNSAAIGRIKLGGGNNTNYRMRLHIVYSLVQ